MSQRFAIDKTTLSRNLRLLESRGWIEPAKGNDRRERRFGITPVGRERLHSAYPAWNRAQADLKSAMTASEWNQMFRAFRTAARVAIDRRSRISRGEKIA
jgi:DNA-binding MarR family transcriptional regulator